MIFGIKRTGTFIPSPSDENDAGHPAAQWAALIARDRAASAADGPRGTATPTTSSTGKTAAEPTCQTSPSSVRDVITTYTHGRYTITMDTHTIPVITHPRTPIGNAGRQAQMIERSEQVCQETTTPFQKATWSLILAASGLGSR